MKEKYNLYYDKQGKPIDLLKWAKLFENFDYKRVALTEFKGCRVSTVWLGLNHNFSQGTPLIFETMVFGGEQDGYEERYATLKEAKEGHKKIVKMVKDKKK